MTTDLVHLQELGISKDTGCAGYRRVERMFNVKNIHVLAKLRLTDDAPRRRKLPNIVGIPFVGVLQQNLCPNTRSRDVHRVERSLYLKISY